MFKLLKRTTETAAKLPFAMAWDIISLGNLGEGTSTGKVLRENGYDLRIDIDGCTDWEVTPNVGGNRLAPTQE